MRAAAAWRRKRSIFAWLRRIQQALDQHDECDTAQLLPPERRPQLNCPVLGGRGLVAIRTRLVEKLVLIDEPHLLSEAGRPACPLGNAYRCPGKYLR
jgi:hypothetical protein